MTSAISGVSGFSSMMMSGAGRMQQRPDSSKMAEQLFSKLDTKSQGYLEESDLEAAFGQVSSDSDSSDATSVEEVFQALDSDSDGKLTQQEMADNLKKLSDALDSQFNSMRMNGMGGGMPPPPPAGGADSVDSAGFTEDELTSMVSEASSRSGSSDDSRISLMSSIVANFDEADTNGDGKVSNAEAMAYEKAQQQSNSSGSMSIDTVNASSASNVQDEKASVMKRIMQLMASYGVFGDTSGNAASGSTLSVAA